MASRSMPQRALAVLTPRGERHFSSTTLRSPRRGDILRPAVAQARIIPGKDGLVRITLKRAFSDGTIAIDVDPLSLLCRLAAAVPYPRFPTVGYSGVLASASTPSGITKHVKLRPRSLQSRSRLLLKVKTDACIVQWHARCRLRRQSVAASKHAPWAELLKRTFGRAS
jgi:Putative transposase